MGVRLLLGALLLLLALPGSAWAVGAGPASRTTSLQAAASSPHSGGAALSTAAPARETPLQITLTSLVPGVIPRTGPLVLSGTLTNRTRQRLGDVRLAPVLSATPLTDVTQLREQLARPIDSAYGSPRESADAAAEVGEVPAGSTVRFTLTLTQDELRDAMTDDPGVHWVGIQAYGAIGDGALGSPLGAARTLMPLMPSRTSAVQAGVVVPLRHRIVYGRSGAIVRLDSWLQDLAPGGRLANLLALTRAVPPGRMTWLVDPAVLDAAERLAEGNPRRSVIPPDDEQDGDDGDGGADPSQSPSEPASPSDPAEPSGSSSPTSTLSSGGSAVAASLPQRDPTSADLSRLARTWLDGMTAALRREQVLALPYADLDVGGVVGQTPALISRARRLSRLTLTDRGIDSTPAIAPTSGRVSPAVVAAGDAETRVLAADSVLPDDLREGGSAPTAVEVTDVPRLDEERVLDLYDEVASLPAAGQSGAQSALGVRQRLLAETALRSIAGDQRPLNVMLPSEWNPGRLRANFFGPLRLSWLSLAPLGRIIRPDTPRIDADELRSKRYPKDQRFTADQVLEVNRMIRAAGTLQGIVTNARGFAREVSKQALTYVAYAAHSDPITAETSALAGRQTIGRQLRRVSISVPKYWTMSGPTGRFRVDVHNGLGASVSVQIAADTDPSLTIKPSGPIVVPPGERRAVLLEIDSTRQGVHRVKLALTDQDGTRLGRSAEVPMRSSQVSRLLWLIMGIALAVLVLGVLMRLWRRWRQRGPDEQPDEQPDDHVSDHPDDRPDDRGTGSGGRPDGDSAPGDPPPADDDRAPVATAAPTSTPAR